VALDAAIEAVLPGAYTLVRRCIALVLEQFHVVPAHEIGALDALLAFAGLNHRFRHAAAIRG
jgi:UDP-N-acetylmuramoylalanine-D-glutamate ligase